jgi:hypothetical protein
VRIGRLATSQAHRGQRLGELLLQNAVKRSAPYAGCLRRPGRSERRRRRGLLPQVRLPPLRRAHAPALPAPRPRIAPPTQTRCAAASSPSIYPRPRSTPAVANQKHAGQGIAVTPYFYRIEQMKRNAPDRASTRDYPAPVASGPRRALPLGTTSPRRV